MTQKSGTTYIIPPEKAAEMGRLQHQGRMLTRAMGGLLSEYSAQEIGQMKRVLDLACGPGDWSLELAQAYPHLEVTAFDVSTIMVQYATSQARALGLRNVSFQVLNATKLPLSFESGLFDLINARFILGFMHKEMWAPLFAECMRLLRPGGILRLTEDEVSSSNSESQERILTLLTKALVNAGHLFMSRGETTARALIPTLKKLMHEAGFEHLQLRPYILDFSTGTEENGPWLQNAEAAFELLTPFLVAKAGVQKEALEALIEEVKQDYRSPDFYAMYFFLTCSGKKPA